MKIIINGQQAFGEAVLKALLERGENVVGVYCEPDKEDRPPDPIKALALERGLDVSQPTSYRRPDVHEQMASLEPDLCVMAYVTLFVPEEALNIPAHGSIQYHPSLLPLHRGGSSINWPIIWGETKTGLSIFWPDDGLDEGPILMQKEVSISDDDTLGSLYFNHLFPLGVEAMMESVDLVRDGKAPKIRQDHTKATYEGWCRSDLVRINWHQPTQTTWNLIRGCNPAPGAWTTFEERKVALFDCEKVAQAKSVQPGQVTAIGEQGVSVATSQGQILVKRLRADGGKKIAAGEWAREVGLKAGARFR
ncbi:MAG: methionyl-tRNA formyltransferase [Gammaproteobacteria bacterium]